MGILAIDIHKKIKYTKKGCAYLDVQVHQEKVVDVVEVAKQGVQAGQLLEPGHHYVEHDSRIFRVDTGLELVIDQPPARVLLCVRKFRVRLL